MIFMDSVNMYVVTWMDLCFCSYMLAQGFDLKPFDSLLTLVTKGKHLLLGW